eukprot:TRINITY_DN13022_c0_g1_i1.p1 TRINITY_DN13022_c0_g1~~TRINITY_DN13022_c0_g1_i1.p1  ORF type:complete len:333 (-),score=82.95 TRINITY_DN13022_c0_g1_i1:22-1020(-)
MISLIKYLAPILLAFILYKLKFRFTFDLSLPEINQSRLSIKEKNINKLNILTQNIWAHYLVLAPERKLRLKQFIEHLSMNSEKYDVVCLQELFILKIGPLVLMDEAEYFIKEMSKLGYIYYTSPLKSISKKFNLKVQNSGLISFSKYPIVEHEFHNFEDTVEPINNKGFEKFKVKVGNKTVNFTNAHLDGKGSMRMSQVDQISRKMKKEDLFVAVGDWNINSINVNSPPFKTLEEKMNAKDQMTLRNPSLKTFRTKPSFLSQFLKQIFGSLIPPLHWPSKTEEDKITDDVYLLDHIFVGDGFSVENCQRVDIRDDVRPISDHFGVYIELNFK